MEFGAKGSKPRGSRPGKKPLVEYKGFLYQAAGWSKARRVVAKDGEVLDQSFENEGVGGVVSPGGGSPVYGEGMPVPSGDKCGPNSGQRVYTCYHREAIMEIPVTVS